MAATSCRRLYGDSGYLLAFATPKEGNVDLYRHFSFELIEQMPLGYGGLTMYAMSRAEKSENNY